MFPTPSECFHRVRGFLALFSPVAMCRYPLLLLYALVYLSVPIWRWFRLQTRNAEIESRNEVWASS